MSFQAVAWALNDAPDVKPNWVGVLVVLAEKADEKGRGAWPSQATIAYKARKSERQVRVDLKALEEAALIRRGNQHRVAHLPADRRPVVYDLAMERKRTDTAPWDEHPSGTSQGRVEAHFPPESTESENRPSREEADIPPVGNRGEAERQPGGSAGPTGGKCASTNPSMTHPEPSIHPVAPQTSSGMDGWMDGSPHETTCVASEAAVSLVDTILTEHRVPRTRRPANGTLGAVQSAAQRLLDAGVAASDVREYVLGRGVLSGAGISVPGAVLAARLNEMPVITGNDPVTATVAATRRCYGPNCLNGRLICTAECGEQCSGVHGPRGTAGSCPDC